jgi:putative transposase
MLETTSKKRSRVDWEALMARYEISGLTQREFCAQQGLAYSSFCYWRKRLRTIEAVENKAPPLIELPSLPSSELRPWRIELDLGQGVVLRLR